MKNHLTMNKLIFILLTCCGIFFICAKDEPTNSTSTSSSKPTQSSTLQNLIANPSFEVSAQASASNWYCSYSSPLILKPLNSCISQQSGNDSLYKFTKDAPTAGGQWSLFLKGYSQSPPTQAYTFITGQSGTNIYQLTFMAKTMDYSGGSKIYIQILNQNNSQLLIHANTSQWKQYTLTDTLTTSSQDTIKVMFECGGPGLAWGSFLFDLIELKKTGI